LPIAAIDIATPRGSKGRASCVIAPLTTSFYPGPGSQSIIATAIRVMGFKYLASLKSTKFNEVKAKIRGAPMIYKGIE